MATDSFEAQKRYAKRQESSGMVRVSTWVPEGCREEALSFMASLRNRKASAAKKGSK